MHTDRGRHTRSPFERFLGHFTLLRPGEGRCVVLFFSAAFLILVAYYVLKTLREPLLLVAATAEMKSYAYATIALILLFLIPAYGQVFRRISKRRFTRYITLFFVMNLAVFYLLGRAGWNIGFAYYVWVGIVSLVLTAQFWGYAADTYNPKSGQRLFPLIMLGATLGGLAGPILAGKLFEAIGPWNLMIVVAALLMATLPIYGPARDSVPSGSRDSTHADGQPAHLLGGLAMVARDRYLMLLAVLIVLLNWINTTGEYILAEVVVRHADQRILADPSLDKGALIAAFYGTFYFAVNLLTVLVQLVLVARIFRWIGLHGAVLILPIIVFLGYGMIAFVPVFAVISVFKVVENSTDYSLMNTTRHALYLPLVPAHKYEGKVAIETFFWRLGDLIQAGVVFAGLHWFGFGTLQFSLLNMALAVIWLYVAIQLGTRYDESIRQHSVNEAPRFEGPLEPARVSPGRPFQITLPLDCFTDPDPGDVLVFGAESADGTALPRWLHFDDERLSFSGTAPDGLSGTTDVLLTATDFDGARAEGWLVLVHDD